MYDRFYHMRCVTNGRRVGAGTGLDSFDDVDTDSDDAGADVVDAAAVGKDIRRQGHRRPAAQQADQEARPRLPSWLERSQDQR